jgi:hypothetical protein
MTNGNDSINNSEQGPQDGLTKREYFAAMAMQGLLAKPNLMNPLEEIVQTAVSSADALIKSLNNENN